MPIFFGAKKKSVRETPGGSDPRSRARISVPLPLQQSLFAYLCCLQRMVSAAQTPSVRRVELGVRCVLSFLLVIREHAVPRRSLRATLPVPINPLAAPSGAIADGLTPYPVLRAEVMWIGLLGLRLDRSGVQSGDPGAQCVQVWHRSRSCVRRGSKSWKAHRRSPLEGSRLHVRFDEPSGRARGMRCL
jgi:hypothetical protein